MLLNADAAGSVIDPLEVCPVCGRERVPILIEGSARNVTFA